MSDSNRHSSSGESHRHQSGHHSSHHGSRHSGSHHHSSHSHHRYNGPRSSQASGLSDEYSMKFSEDDIDLPSVERLNDEILDQDFYDDISRSLEKQMLFEEDRMKGAGESDDVFADLEDSIRSTNASTEETAKHSSGSSTEQPVRRSSGSSTEQPVRRSSGSSTEQPAIRSSESSYDNGSSQKKESRKKSGKNQKKHLDAWNRSKRRRKRIITGLLILIGILLAIILTFLILRFRGEMNLKNNIVETPVEVKLPEEAEEENDENLIVYNGERYWYNEDIITILCIGVDRQEFASPDDMVIGGNGQADADFLVILDKKSGKISFLNISRDAMTDIDRYNMEGQYIDTVNEQLCLSFAFGDGKQTSCENTALSVSRLLYGIPINAYAAIDFESIGTLNDAVGGVSVPVTEDIADKYPGTQVGALVKLVGSEAVTYVRTRDIAQLDSNNARMSRQKQYIIAFLKTLLQQLKSDPTKAVSLFNAVSDNMVTSIKLSEVTYFGTFFAQHGFSEQNISSVQGEVVMGEDGFAQFIPDEKALFETVLDLFYIKE